SIYEEAYVHALRPVFLAAAGVGLLGFAVSWRLEERELRDTAATSTGLEDSLAAPRSPDSLAEIERALARAVSPERRRRFRERLDPGPCEDPREGGGAERHRHERHRCEHGERRGRLQLAGQRRDQQKHDRARPGQSVEHPDGERLLGGAHVAVAVALLEVAIFG